MYLRAQVNRAKRICGFLVDSKLSDHYIKRSTYRDDTVVWYMESVDIMPVFCLSKLSVQ